MMDKNFFKDERAYVQASIALMVTVLLSYMIFICVLPVMDTVMGEFIGLLDGNQFYTETLEGRMISAQDLGWKMPFFFIGIGAVFIFFRTIIRQRYTRYSDEEEY